MTGPPPPMPPFKRPIPLAPAPPRFASSTSNTSIGSAMGGRGSSSLQRLTPELPLSELSSDSSDDETLLVARTTAPEGYAELEGEDDLEVEEMNAEEEEGTNRDELIRARVAASQEQMRDILASLTPAQLQRYETFRRVGFPRPMIKKIMTKVLDGLCGKDNKNAANLNASTVIVIAGIAKVFVGELIEESKNVQEDWKDPTDSALMPSHVLEAMRRLKQKNLIPPSQAYRRRCQFL